ncbi:MAG: signal recognition particle-docking protein FtsY [Scytonematopsis contorta HA4267-MV1]|jgi:fused signal recognition particle receptor|nr:signal recognition particle-docking protein FtsY [Scytonematopsis contorta HA4267-MV1]
MAFNWFRRKYDESSSTPEEEKQEKQETESTEAPTVADAATPDTTVDLLAYAKAAYKNIQQRQETGVAETPVVEEFPNTVVNEDTEAANSESNESEVLDITAEPAIAETTVESTESEVSVATEESELATPEVNEPETSATPSFLERAAAERQARLEQLNQSVVETDSEPEIITPTTSTTALPITEAEETQEISSDDLEEGLDEGFLWSTEVLAKQGRRVEDVSIEEINWLQKLRRGLSKTRRGILNTLKSIVGKGPLNQAGVEEIESLLLQADVGVEATDYIIQSLQTKLKEEALPPEQAIAYLKEILRSMLDSPLENSQKTSFYPEKGDFNIWLIVGVNGAGKTTTIGKLAHLANKSGYKCLIGAADTFRAAAVEQVKVWGTRSGVEVVANPGKNTDPAAVVFDAIAAAVARDTELLLVDTAGRLQNKKNLMDELSKVRRIINKKAPKAKVESLLVLDATLGQNGLRQAQVFSEAAQLSGVVLTKLDSTAKGGVALGVVQQLGLPIRFIGAGEGMEDLRPFSSYEFVEALLSG